MLEGNEVFERTLGKAEVAEREARAFRQSSCALEQSEHDWNHPNVSKGGASFATQQTISDLHM